jgi:hypothetical protein
MNVRPALGRRWLALAAAVVVTASGVVALGAATAVGVRQLHPHPLRGVVGQADQVVVDEAVYRLTMQRLDQVRVELDRTLGGSAPAVVEGCSADESGRFIFQPRVYKPIGELNVEEAANLRATEQAAAALRAVGWTVDVDASGTVGVDAGGRSYRLWMRRDGWTAIGDFEGLAIYVLVKDAEACRWG